MSYMSKGGHPGSAPVNKRRKRTRSALRTTRALLASLPPCPRCRARLYDFWGWPACLYCGYEHYVTVDRRTALLA